MCGRFTLEPTARFYDRFQITNRLDSLTPRYNIAPGQLVPVVIAHSPNRVVLMRWGLIPHWAKGHEIPTFTIVTRDADDAMARLHNRMPVVLAQEDEQAWLDPDITAPAQAVDILARSAGVPLDAYPVSRMVNTPSVEGKELIQPVA